MRYAKTNKFTIYSPNFILSKMATLTLVAPDERQKALANAPGTTLSGGLKLPEGKHLLVVANKNSFGILNVDTGANKWSLPIVAGTVRVEETGQEEVFTLSEKAGAKVLVVADQFYLIMRPNAEYLITIGTNNKGRKVVTHVEPLTEKENVVPENQVRTNASKKKALAF
jgi:hypothetical protein